MAEQFRKRVDQIRLGRAWEQHQLEEKNRALQRKQKETIVRIDDELKVFFELAQRYFPEQQSDAITFNIGRPQRNLEWKEIPEPVRRYLGYVGHDRPELHLEIFSGPIMHMLSLYSKVDAFPKRIDITTRVNWKRSWGNPIFDIRPLDSILSDGEEGPDIFQLLGGESPMQARLDIAQSILAFAWSSANLMAQREHEALRDRREDI